MTCPKKRKSDLSRRDGFGEYLLTETKETTLASGSNPEGKPVGGLEVPLKGAFRGQELLKALAEDRALDRY